MERNNEITRYLRKAVLAQVDKGIDFKNEEFYKLSRASFTSGIIASNITEALFEKYKKETQKQEEKKDNIDENIYVILATKVIRTEVEGSQKKDEREDLTGVFFIPAILNKKTSTLLPSIEDNKLPWFPREILKPMIEPELAIGDGEIYDKVVSDEIYNIYKINNWQEYMDYCKYIYESTTTCGFESNEIYNLNGKKEKILLEDNVYIFLDKTINPTYHVKKLYTDIIKQDIPMPLYQNFIVLKEERENPLIKNTIENRKKHCGQMGGKFELSPSQREGLNHFNNTQDGEILAIKGPPGTGKTTLIQSILASEYVKNALARKLPPLIVASSTNNQAVTNIIESFGKIVPKFNNNLETRWIEKVKSFAIYFPSKQKIKEARGKGFQYTNNRGEYFISEIDNEENIRKSKEKFLTEVGKLFSCTVEKNELTTYKEKLHDKLTCINIMQKELIDLVKELSALVGNENINEFTKNEKENIKRLKEEKDKYLQRVQFWRNKYKEIPGFWKILSWLRVYKIKISNRLKLFLNEDEELVESILNIDEIESYYAKRIEKNNELIRTLKTKLQRVETYISKYKTSLDNLEKCFINIDDITENLIINEKELDKWLDINTRYVSFWLAVHYYEARWLEGECALKPKQKGTNYSNVLTYFYRRLSMIIPCMVMTFYMLPKQFAIFGEDAKEFLYNMIDILIVDEAGQVSTEIAACSFALAKKAIVVGDEKQIQPVWGIEKALDKSLAIQEKAINNEREFEVLERFGITASNSSVMKVACKSSKYSKYGEKGLFLSEHRRCYNDIIQYCNELVYKGQLEPLRGNKVNSEEILPKMGYYLIETQKSKKVGTSRNNTNEAVGIARWILENEKKIFEYYSKVEQDKVLGVITPFKKQAKEIKRVFKEILPKHIKDKITVGTVHVFQGSERKIMIMSTTYGRADGCFFIDNNKNLMNVAVSRAEDSFLVFGDINCLKDEEQSPSGLLKKYIIPNRIF